MPKKFLGNSDAKNILINVDTEVLMEYWFLTLEMDMLIQVQILYEAVYISLSTNILGKGMNLSFLHSAIGK